MNSSRTLRLLAVTAALGSAIAAQAITLDVVSSGTYTVSGSVWNFTETVYYQATNPLLAQFNTVNLSIDTNTLAGTAKFSNTAGTQTMDISYQLNGYSNMGAFYSGAGTWNYVTGTGDYANKFGGGTLTQNAFTNNTSDISTFRGELQAVPEPASMAALAIGGLGLMRRRRKA